MKLNVNMKKHWKAYLSITLLFLASETLARKKTRLGSELTKNNGPADADKSESAVTNNTGSAVPNNINSVINNPIGTIPTNGVGTMGTNETGPAVPNKIGSMMNKTGSIPTNETEPVGTNMTGPIGTGQTRPIGTNVTGSIATSNPGSVPTNQTGSEETKVPEPVVTSKPPTGSVPANKFKTGPTWGYGVSGTGFYGPADWDIVSSQCKGNNQSPIDIFPHATPFKAACRTMLLESDNKLGLVTGVLSNTGHAVQFKVNQKDGTAFLSGGPADSANYRLSSIQFHIGCMDGSGSEHTINSKPSSAEMQMVFYNKKYKNINEALSQPDGIAIISSLFDYYGGETYYHNPTLERLVSFLPNITQPGSSVNLDHDDRIELTKLVQDLTRDCPPYYTYKGSLTTPPCYESVTWIVLKTRLTISIQQLGQFRQLQSRDGSQLCDNFRLIQPTNNREVTKNYLLE